MPDHKKTYSQEANLYHLLTMREDFQQALPRALEKLLAGSKRDALELGAGTGRLTNLLYPLVNSITALELSHAMLVQAKDYLQDNLGNKLPVLAAADHRSLPAANNSVSLIAAGWSVCYLASWYPETWRTELEKGLAEMYRVLQPGGMIVLIETQGTGKQQPDPPAHLIPYLAYLDQAGFDSTWIRTDYLFENRQEAVKLAGFFFGDEMLSEISTGSKPILPECTGIWWKNVSAED